MKILSALLVSLLLVLTWSQVIGIDMGTEYWKASLISPGRNLVIVENSRSSRKSVNGISFEEGLRYFQDDAVSKRLKKPKNSYFYLNKFIESLDHASPLSGAQFENGTYYFTEQKLRLEQMVGMILKNLKKHASKQAGTEIKDSVFTVPISWGFKAKLCLVNAAYLADLSVLGLINENSAAAIHYGISRVDNQPVNIGFFNLGSYNMQFSIIQFFGYFDQTTNKTFESMRSLVHVGESNVGGLRVDEELAKYVAEQFQSAQKKKNPSKDVDILKNEKAYAKLLSACSDLKQTLSANKEATIYVEGIIEGLDLRVDVKREIIENLSFFQQIETLLTNALDKAGLSKGDIQAVELIGGSTRIPLVSKKVKDFFSSSQVGSHINGDESMSFGSALRAANLSIAFRVKQLHFYDGLPLHTRVVVTSMEKGVIKEEMLCSKDSEQGLKREVMIQDPNEDFKATVYYGQDILHEYLSVNTSKWNDKFNETETKLTEKPRLIFSFACNSVTVAELKELYVNLTYETTTFTEELEYYEEEQANSTVEQTEESTAKESIDLDQENKEENKETQNKEEKDEKEQSKQDKSAQEEVPSATNTTSEEKNQNNDQAGPKKQKKRKPIKITKSRKVSKISNKMESKKIVVKFDHIFSKYRRFSKEQLDLYKGPIFAYETHEKAIYEKSQIRNNFETTLYNLKDEFDSPSLKKYSKDQQLESLKQIVVRELSWLQDNAWTAETSQFRGHMDSLYSAYEPILNRSLEHRDREKSYNKTIEYLSTTYGKTIELNGSSPWVSEKAVGHLQKINKTVDQIHKKLSLQVKLELNADPVIYNHEMINKAEELREEYYLIKMIPRPKVKKVKPKEEVLTDHQTIDLDETQKQTQDTTQSDSQSGADSNKEDL